MDMSTLYAILSAAAFLATLYRAYKVIAGGDDPGARPDGESGTDEAGGKRGGKSKKKKKMETRAVSKSELARATGVDTDTLYIALKDPYSDKVNVFDVSAGRDFYGPGCAYHVFVGKNATHGLATSSVDPDKVEGDISGLTESQKDTHLQWHAKYTSKYPVVGYLVADDAAAAAAADDTASVVTTESGAAESKKDA